VQHGTGAWHVVLLHCALPSGNDRAAALCVAGHTAAVKGVAIAPSGDLAVSCSTDATVRLWRLPYAPFHAGDVEQADQAVLQFQGAHGFR
jgi:WD40 repeat protein